ncbi:MULTISPECIES: TUL4 family lipoprotein [unclassified Francisella]|uniref:TUL4 family lipoprotein n=1 Tax=unclassified Francisella TaxID=2610885 RepID=UPI002E305006|nr:MULTISPECIES: TUL4 family lipoprotein [unclassified Francisella]MED7818679.1 TUL4 family lipoprotein [Francisella sp. 19S2-4]MED7829604.1 TUL4 family lipoprotein [Francisella sp. 19S2-10]
MKNILKLSAISLAVIGLASCSTLGFDSKDAKDSQSQQTADQAKTQETTTVSGTTAPTASIKLKKNSQDQIVAKIYTTYNNNPQGSVKLQWEAPKGTKCYDTSFPITKYSDKKDKTWASVEIKQGKTYCHGTWTANVVFDKNVIATDSITV